MNADDIFKAFLAGKAGKAMILYSENHCLNLILNKVATTFRRRHASIGSFTYSNQVEIYLVNYCV